jgi:hypothetical protein
MEALAIAAATIAAQWAAEAFVKEASKSSFAALKPIYEWVKSKLGGDAQAAETFGKLAANPKDPVHTSEVAKALTARLEADPSLKDELTGLLATAEQDRQARSFVVQVMDNAKVGKITNIGTIFGTVNF